MTKRVIFTTLFALLLFSGAIYFFRKNALSLLQKTTKERIQSILPQNESPLKIEAVEGGFSNNLWRVETEAGVYMFRSPKKMGDISHFKQVLQVSKIAFESGLTPRIVGENVCNQEMLLEYIDHIPWPSYEENSRPYKSTMHLLRCFHEKMQLFNNQKATSTPPAPFSFIFHEGEKLEKTADMPAHFKIALKKTKRIFTFLKPWLKNHTTLCHGDFHKGNVLLSKTEDLTPLFVDFDSITVGDPLFDVVKFSIGLPHEKRLELFTEYLGGRFPTPQERLHFELIDLSLLMVITIVRFNSAQYVEGDVEERLSRSEMEETLNSNSPLPSFLSIPFDDTLPKSRQKGALFALSEFLNRASVLLTIDPE